MSIVFKPPGDDILATRAQVLINPVNCVGVMGKGLALEFKNRFPENFNVYQLACNRRELRPGHLLVVPTGNTGLTHIINLATKDHWRDPSKLSWVVQGAREVRLWAEENGIESVACPALGSGQGKLPWSDVRAVLESEVTDSSVRFEVHEPHELLLETKKESAVVPPSPPQMAPTGPSDSPAKRLIFRKPMR
jgi:O-acetyl-ADP-ribose deacetylase (regulator of RNase III)